MRVFIAVLVLIFSFQSWTKADDITDFEIEGITVGDSLLDYFSEEEIKNSLIEEYYSDIDDKTFIDAHIRGNFELYEGLQISIKRKDKKYIVYAIAGGITYYKKDIKECHSKLKIVTKELEIEFKNSKKNLYYKQVHRADKTGKSTALASSFFLDSGSITVRCTDWSDEITNKYNWVDSLRVSINSKEFLNWLKLR